MSILSDLEIIEFCRGEAPMISPFVDHQVRYRHNPDLTKNSLRVVEGIEVWDEKVISWGLSSYGYDLRIADEFKIFSNIKSACIDPLHFDDETYVDFKGEVCILPPNSYALARSVEYFNLPRDVTAICLSKSTYARAGCIINATVAEAGWSGELVIEISNATSLPLKIYANMGIAQLLFFKGDVSCKTSYADRGGKYMFQKGIQLPIG